MSDQKHIVIVGGGITGLSAAFYLQQEIKQQNLPYTVRLVEASDRLGGKIQTIKKDGFIIERGADSFLARKKPAIKLIEKLGIEDELVRNDTGQAYVHVNNKLHKIPKGSFMGIPVNFRPFMFSGLFSSKGKMRAALDYVVPKTKDSTEDQSLGYFFRRRFGNELVENLIEPLLSGIYSGDIDEMSLMATFPNFYELEQKYGSLVKGLQQTMPKRKQGTGKRPGQFLTFKNGFSTLIDALENALDPSIISRGVAVDHIERKEGHYHLLLSNAEVLKAHAVILASPHGSLPTMLSKYPSINIAHDIKATSVANVAFAFDEKAIKRDMDGTGFVVSRNSDFRITACTWTHRKWPTTTPKGKILLRTYVGKPTDQEVVNLSDEEIVNIVLNDLKTTMKIRKKPLFHVVTRWKNIMPQYTVGHQEKIKTLRNQVKEELPGVFLTGSSYEGVGVPDCIEQGEEAVNSLLDYLKLETL